MKSQSIIFSLASTVSTLLISTTSYTNAFSPSRNRSIHVINASSSSSNPSSLSSPSSLFSSTVETDSTSTTSSFIDTELRGAAMKLHTKSQAPKEGEAAEKPKPSEPYITTHSDYLKFLIDSQYVYRTFESIVQQESLHPELQPFCNTKLERGDVLEIDIEFMVNEYGLERFPVGQFGLKYGEMLKKIAEKGKEGIPEFMCHYYNFYFAHTAGGRMIGKQMAALLLDKKTLEFYKWDGDLNEIKANVKNSIEEMAASWTREQKDQCVDATAAAFMGGGGINAYLSGGRGGGHH